MEIMANLTENTKEINLETLVNYAKSNNLRFEAFTPKFDRWNYEIGCKSFHETQIGIELKPNIWFWWEQLGDHTFFNHRYNQNTGGTIKSFRKGWNAERQILAAS